MTGPGWRAYGYENLEPGEQKAATLATQAGALRVTVRCNGEGQIGFRVEQVEAHGQGVACPVAEGVIGQDGECNGEV